MKKKIGLLVLKLFFFIQRSGLRLYEVLVIPVRGDV